MSLNFGGFQARVRRDPLRGREIVDEYDVIGTLRKGGKGQYGPHELTLKAQEMYSLRHQGLTTIGQLRSKIEILPHQVQCAMTVLNDMDGRAILADEVGLGKTIEAGIIMKELIVRGRASSVLILTPASLASQWQQELWDKFGERFIRHDDPEFRGFDKHEKIVSSIDTAKSASHQKHIIEKEWDLVIIDEAHYLKNKRTQRYHLTDQIRARHALMLTATPIQNDLMELFNLVNLIKPKLLGTEKNFENEYVGQDIRQIRQPELLQEKLRTVMVRNRRGETKGIKFPERRVDTRKVTASDEEFHLHRSVSQFIRKYKSEFESHLGLLILEREVASSGRALVKTLQNMLPRQDNAKVKEAMMDLRDQARHLSRNAKLELILETAEKISDKMIIFTQFRETQDLLEEELSKKGVSTVKYHGQLNAKQRKEALRQFRDTDTQILLATDSGSEGLNLQFCHILVNYDLPWNPMRVEQRIGRVHRIGQMKDHVYILNLAVANTIEDYVLEVLYEKIRLFEVAIGEMDLILSDVNDSGGLEKRIFEAILNSDSDEELPEKLAKVETEVRRGKQNAENVKKLDAAVFSQFDLSTVRDRPLTELVVDMDQVVEEFMHAFVQQIGGRIEAGDDPTIQVLHIPSRYHKRLGSKVMYTRDLETFQDHDGEVQFITMGSDFVEDAVQFIGNEGRFASYQSKRARVPQFRFYVRIEVTTLQKRYDRFLTIVLDGTGKRLEVRQELIVPPAEGDCNLAPLSVEETEALLASVKTEAGTILDDIIRVENERLDEQLKVIRMELKTAEEKQREESAREQNRLAKNKTQALTRLDKAMGTSRQRKAQEAVDKAEKALYDFLAEKNRKLDQLKEEVEDQLQRERSRRSARINVHLMSASYLEPLQS